MAGHHTYDLPVCDWCGAVGHVSDGLKGEVGRHDRQADFNLTSRHVSSCHERTSLPRAAATSLGQESQFLNWSLC
jgi:hypothetical protein